MRATAEIARGSALCSRCAEFADQPLRRRDQGREAVGKAAVLSYAWEHLVTAELAGDDLLRFIFGDEDLYSFFEIT